MVLLNMSIPEILMNGNIDLKQKYLKINNKSIKNVIKLNNDGKIKDEDLKLMRVLFSK